MFLSRYEHLFRLLRAALPLVALSAGLVVVGLHGFSPAAAAAGGSISGTVTDASTHLAIEHIEVTLYDATDDAMVASTSTAADGTYTFSGEPTGTYKVGFSGGDYPPQFYDRRSSLASADRISVTDGSAATGVDAAMGGQITGTVIDASTREGIGNAQVEVYDAQSTLVGSTLTTADGNYAVSGLGSGSYRVGFAASGHKPQFYDDKPSLRSADPIQVAGKSIVTGIDATMQPSGQITGTVTDASTHEAVGGASVNFYDSGGHLVSSATTNASGTYASSYLTPGSYRVGFAASLYQPQFYEGKSSLATAEPVQVAAGSTITGIDAALVALPGQISGTVTDASTHDAIVTASVTAYGAAGNVVATTTTDASGAYTLSNLAPGFYRVRFLASGYETQFYELKPSLASADPVQVTAGSTTTAVSAALAALPGQISGTLTDSSSHDPIAGASVTVYGAAGNVVATTTTDTSGAYTSSNLTPGSYRVGFLVSGYEPQFYNGRPSLASADPVQVRPGSRTTGIDGAIQANRPGAPVNTIAPRVSGSTIVGYRLTATTGNWSGAPPAAFAYQWQRCTSACENITRATQSSYVLAARDLGTTVRVVVVAHNRGGYGLAVSAKLGPVAPSLGQIKSLLLAQIVPFGKSATIEALLHNNRYSYRCSALSGGLLAIYWYQVPRGAHLSKAGLQPVLVATGQKRFASAGTATIAIGLTRKGKQLLRRAKRLELTAKSAFTPSGRPAARARATFTLPRKPRTLVLPTAAQLGANVNRLFNSRAYTRSEIDSQLQPLRDTGATIARSDALWEASEPNPPVAGVHRYDWSFDDLIAGALAAHGLQWLPIIDYAPDWAQSNPQQLHGPPRSASDYADYARAFAARYGSNGAFWRSHPDLKSPPVATYELWNEPDFGAFWAPVPDASRYARLYLAARAAIKTADPKARVLVGGLVAANAFLPALLTADPGLRGRIDGVAIHPYGPNPLEVLSDVREARLALRSLGLPRVALYVTEFGWTTQPAGALVWASEETRPSYISATLGALGHLDCGVSAALLYTWFTPQADPADPEDWYGIRSPDGGSGPDSNAFAQGIRMASAPGRAISLCGG